MSSDPVAVVRGRAIRELERALAKLQEKRDAEIQSVHERYAIDIAAIEKALSEMGGDPQEVPALRPQRRTQIWVGDKRLDAVRRYVMANGPCRQADIAKDLEMNTGSVSSALRVLAGTDDPRSPQVEVVALPNTLRGSRLWEYVGRKPRKRGKTNQLVA